MTSAYDAWLTTNPADRHEAAFELWCERNDRDGTADDWDDFYEAMYETETP